MSEEFFFLEQFLIRFILIHYSKHLFKTLMMKESNEMKRIIYLFIFSKENVEIEKKNKIENINRIPVQNSINKESFLGKHNNSFVFVTFQLIINDI